MRRAMAARRRAAAMGYGLACLCAAATSRGAITLTDVTKASGIAFVHTDGSSGARYIMETVSAGLATFDYDGDGDIDIYFVNGAPLRGASAAVPPRNALYRNDGNWKFTDVTAQAGVGDTGYGLGATVGDYDNDGRPDLYVSNYGPNVLYRNNGDGTFTDTTAAAGVADGAKVGAGVCFLDMDADGDLDLFVANYLEFSYDLHVSTSTRGVPVYANPRYYKPEAFTLFRNNGHGTFTDVSRESGIAAHRNWGMGIVCLDYDNDGDTDIFTANDVADNFLFQNDGRGNFEEVGLIAGVAYDMNGDEQGSMGVDCNDYDNDGRLDLYMTAYQSQFATLYRNRGDGTFEDATLRSGAGIGTLATVEWGNGFIDFDNDGWRDIFLARGHLQDTIDQWDDTASYEVANQLFRNQGDGTFRDVSAEAGGGMRVRLSSRGAAFEDLDNDGDIDVVIVNSRREPTLLRNDSPRGNHWLQVELRGVRANRGGVGARVKVVAGDLTLHDEVHAGRGYQSHFGSRLHFGLGTRAAIDRIEVKWLGGGTDTILGVGVGVDRRVTITEGTGAAAPAAGAP
ncbi:MAG TPA: hypothetical protein DCM87_07140 [Planctomycetes bacterium]|nr:hypothetical protein [Planctomycetota bacterium]